MEEAAKYQVSPGSMVDDIDNSARLGKAYQDTKEIYSLVGQKENQGWEEVQHQKQIVSEEMHEMLNGIDARDADELLDGIGDTLFTVFGLAHRAGIDIVDIIEKVVAYNWSKFCYTQEQLSATIRKYSDLGIDVYPEAKDHPIHEGKAVTVVFSSEDQTDINGKKYFKGKWLKSIDTKTPDLTFSEECRLV